MQIQRLAKLLLSSIVITAAFGCSDNEHGEPMGFGIPEDQQESIKSCDAAANAFRSSLQPQLIQSCDKCHATEQTPLFAVQDFQLSFDRTLPWVNFNNPQESLLVLNASNNHCQDSDCRGEKPELEKAVQSFANGVRFCLNQNEIEPIDPEVNYRFFRKKVRRPLEQSCARCHGKVKRPRPIDGIVKRLFKAPPFLMGNTRTVYRQTKKYLALDKDTYFASVLYGAAVFPHFKNGDCKEINGLTQEEQAPCKQIIQWWEMEKAYLDSIQGLLKTQSETIL